MASFTEWSNAKKKKTGDGKTGTLTSQGTSSSTSAKGSSFDEWSNEKKKKKETSTLEGWGNASSSNLKETQNYFSTWRSEKDEDGVYSAMKDQRYALLAQADNWRKQYADNKEALSYINSVVSALSDVGGSAKNYFDYYSKWDSEDSYNQYVTQQKEYEGMKTADLVAGAKEVEDLQGILDQMNTLKSGISILENAPAYAPGPTANANKKTAYANELAKLEQQYGSYDDIKNQLAQKTEYLKEAKYVQGYEGYMGNANAEDYATNSQYASTRTDVEMDDALWGLYKNQYDESKLFGDYLYDYINRNQDALDVATVNNTATNSYFLGLDQGFLQTMTEDEIGVYNYLYKTKGKESADAFLTYIGSDLQGRRRAQENAKWAAYAQESPVGSSVFSTLISPLKGLSYLGQAADMLDDGAMEENAGYNRFSEIPSTIRSQVSTTIENSGKWGKVGSFAYNTGMSMADFLFTTAVSGGNQALSLAIMGSGAAADSTIAAKKRGLDDGQAFALGTIAGLAEVAMEKVSLGAWLEGDMSEGALRYVLKNALSEGGEEAGTSVVNLLADIIIAGDKSEWNVAMQKYMAEGKTEAEAFGLVLAENAAQIGLDALGGVLSGAAIGGGTYAGSSAVSGVQYKDIAKDKTAAQNLVSESLELSPDSQYAQKMQGKLDNGKNLTGMQVRNLLAANQEQITTNDKKLIQQAAEKRLTDLGQTEDVSKVAELATKYATGGELTRSEKSILTRSQYGSRVANELLPTNILSGDYSSEWAENIGTKSVNKYTYNIKSILEEMTKVEDPAAYKSITERVGEESHYGVSESGQTTVRNEEGAVTIAEVTKIEDGQLTVKLDDGREVYAGDIDFADDTESRLYTAVANMENITPAAATALVKNFDTTGEQSVTDYVNGIDEAYTYGYYGYSEADLKAGNFTSNLTSEQMMSAYHLGKSAKKIGIESKNDNIVKMRTAAEAEAQKAAETGKEAPKTNKLTITYNEGNGKVVDFDKAGVKLTNKQKAAPVLARVMHDMGLGTNFELFSSYLSKTLKDDKGNPARVFLNDQGVEEIAYSGVYRKKDGTIRIDLNAYNGRQLTLNAMAHELTHFIQQWSTEKYEALADFLVKTYEKTDMTMHERVLREQARLERIRKKDVSYDEAYDEVVANAMSKMLDDGKVMEKLTELQAKDASLAKKLWEGLKKLLNKFFRIYSQESALFHDAADLMDLKAEFEQMQQMWAEAFVEASENFQANLMAQEVGVDPVAVEDVSQYSYSSLAEAAGFVAVENEDGTRSFTKDGNKVSKVTIEDIENSPIGAFINFSLEMKDISKADADRQKKMFADICTMACKTNDFAMTMQFVGSAVFTGMKANADKQYGTTYDFPSICTKTQAVIDAMSAKMMSLGRGLNSNEIVQLYADVFASGNPVPCPECYVFSRWIGIGGLLDNIKKYQDYYGDMAVEDVADAYRKMKAEVSKFADEQGISFGKAKGALTSKLTKEFNKLTEKIEKAQNQGEKIKASDRQRLAELEPMMNTVKSMTWLENVYFADSSLKKVNPNFRVPNEVLFDLNNGEAFASQYKEAWAFRTTQGAGYGKAITPYAEARLGEGVLVTNNTTNAIKGRAQGTLNNYFLNQKGKLDKQSREALKKARMKQKIQAFIGGQRFQSTSDARYENASDYLLAALEMQAMHGMVQAYTKVDGAVPAFSAWGFSINQSLMPLNGGLDADGNVKDTAVGGMKPSVAFENRQKHETAGTITIGVNDNHIRAMFKQLVRDFIIPYHASGGKADVVAEFRRIQEGKEAKGKAVRSTDYSRTQSDKVLSDEVLRWQGKTDAQIQRIHEIRNARIAILTGGKVNMTVVRSNRFLSALYDKLNGGEWDGVKLAKSKVESQIFPNEFWDQTVTYDESAKITKDYLEYCDDLGFLHRFSGMIPSNGKLIPANGYNENGERVQLTDLAYKYDEKGNKTTEVEEFFWKVLTDRRMYDNNGNYLPQKIVTLNDTTTETVTGFAKNNQGREYDKAKAEALAKKIAGEQYSSQETDADRQQYNPFRERFAKERLDLLSDKLGNLFPLSARFEQAIQNDKTPVSNMTVVANSQKKAPDESYYTAGKNAFRKEYGGKTTFSIKQLGIDAEANDSFARESMAKVSDKKDLQTILDLTPEFKQLIEDSRLLAVERTRHNDNKKTSLLCYRLYNAYIRKEAHIDASGRQQTREVPHIVVFNVVQNLNDAKAHMVTDIKDVAISNGHNSSKLKYAAHANGNISIDNIAEVYDVVKSVDRKKGGLRYSAEDERVYKFGYSQKDNGEAYSSQETDADYIRYDRRAILKESKVDEYLYDYAAKSSPKYAQAYIAYVRPRAFLKLTTDDMLERYHIADQAGELDAERLSNSRPGIYLRIDHETGKVTGHEGRHRMAAMDSAGIELVPVLLLDTSNKMSKTDIEQIYLHGQFDETAMEIVRELIPLSYENRDRVVKNFATQSSTQRIGERYGLNKTLRFSSNETDNISNRDLLANAFEGIVQNSNEYAMIQEYKGQVKELNKLEAKLSKLNREIRDILFGSEGARDTKKLRQLQEEAAKVAKEINRQDKKLLNMEASEPLRKVVERERKKEAKKTMDHVKEIQQNKKDRAEQTELRHKIRKTIRDLDKILNRGNKKQNVKEDMKGFVSKALELADYLFTDHVSNDDLIRKGITVRMTPKEAALVKETEEILSKLYDHADSLTDEEFTRLDAKRQSNENKLRDLLTAQRNERLQTPVYNLFSDLVTEYSAFKNSKQDAVKAAYNPEVERFLRTYVGDEDSDRAKVLKNMRVSDMTTEELWKLYNAYQMVLHAVRTANKLFVNGNNTSIEQMVTEIVMDFGSRKIPEKKMAIAMQKLGNKIGWDYEKLYYALDRIGSKAFTDLIMNLANSENIVMQDVMEAAAFRDEIVKKYGFNNWDVNKEIDREFLDHTGKKFKMTLGQLMSLYAYSRREGAWDHIEYGGFVFGEAALTNPKPADSFKLSKEQCEAITGTLTKEQKSYVEDMQKFLSETMGEKGNEVSMMLYGIKMFTEKVYFPIHIAGQFKAQAQESQAKQAAGFGSMSNAGFTHAQNPNAKAPFVLEGFNDVWSDHVNEMSRYHGTVPALEDLRRVMNRSSYSENTAESTSVKVIMENHFGKEAVEYFDNLYREANSGAITDKLQQKSKKMLSLFRKNSVAYSLSVLVQQPASLVRAYAMVDRKYFGFKGVGAISSGVYKAVSSMWNKAYENAYNEMLKYAPGVTMAKEIGGFDTATGGSIRSYLLDTDKSFKQKWETGTAKEKGKAVLDVVDDNAIANLPNVADKIAWIEIWNACKRETLAKHKDLAPTSEEFMKIVGDRFTEVIRATQVYDSIFAKSPMLKSKNLAVQMLVSFMNEPNTVANMAESAVRDFAKGNRMEGLKKAHVLIHSIIFTGVMKSIIYAMRDDDEDETYIEKYIESLTGSLMDDFNPLNYIPIARDVWSVAQGYDVERADMAIVADAISALNKVIKTASTDRDGMTEDELIELDKKVTESSWTLAESLAAFVGIPMKNIRREINAMIDHAKIASANAGKTTAMSTWDTISEAVIDSIPFMGSKSKTDKLYAAIIEGDTEYINRMKATYKTEDSYHTAVRKALRENDPRIKEAAQAHINGDPSKRVSIAKQIIADGFALDDVVAAINTEINAMTPDKESEAKKEKGVYTAADIAIEAANGDWSTVRDIKDDIIQTAQKNGKTKDEAEEAFESSVRSEAKESYLEGTLNDAAAEKLLVEYADMDEDEAASRVNYWSFCKDNPKYAKDINESKYGKYMEFAEPAGISLDVFVQYINGTKGIATIRDEWGDIIEGERDQVLDVIDSLPLTWQQKDALYLAHGLPESRIWDVPW